MDRFVKSLKYTKWKLIIVNLLGFPLFIYAGSQLWAPIGEEGLDSFDGVSSLLWGLTVFPPLAFCTLINIILVREILVGAFYYREWALFVLWIVVVTIWGGAVKYDLTRHYTGAQMPGIDSESAPVK